MMRRDFAKALIAAGVGVAAPSIAGESIASDGDLMLLDEAQRLTVKPGDVVVLSFPGAMRHEHAERIRDHMHTIFPENKVLVLSDGATIGIMGAG